MASSELGTGESISPCVELVTPANPRKMIKASQAAAGRVCIDLEDSIPPGDKDAARWRTCDALHTLHWGGRRVSVRVNGVDTPYFADDVEAIVGSGVPGVTAVVIPKVGSAEDVHRAERLILDVERRANRPAPVELDVLLESPAGIVNAAGIARASPRIATVILGAGDLTVGLGSRAYGPNQADAERMRRVLDYPRAAVLYAGRAAGVRVVDGPTLAPVTDLDAFEQDARHVCFLGFDGKWAVHPAQLPRARTAFAPTTEELAWACETMVLWEEATARGSGVVLDGGGRLIDAVDVPIARRLISAAGTESRTTRHTPR